MLYLDHAATSMPKDPRVVHAMVEVLESGATPDRGAHHGSREAARLVSDAREWCARLLGVQDPDHVVFTLNATDALNIAFKGWLRPGDEVVTTQVEHNSVTRPLRGLQRRQGLRLRVAPADPTGVVSADEILSRVTPETTLVAMAHASNVTGARQPVEEVGEALRARNRRPLLLVDVAQTCGYGPLESVASVADAMAAAGHKGPGGPLGTGLLWVRPGLSLPPLREGGTGTMSESWYQPAEWPLALEAGSPNLPGIAGLGEATRIRCEEQGLLSIRAARDAAVDRFLAGAAEVPGLRVFGPAGNREPVFPVRVDGLSVDEAAVVLETERGLQLRSGLQCAPGCHRALGTFDEGALRLSFGAFPEDREVDEALAALAFLTAR